MVPTHSVCDPDSTAVTGRDEPVIPTPVGRCNGRKTVKLVTPFPVKLNSCDERCFIPKKLPENVVFTVPSPELTAYLDEFQKENFITADSHVHNRGMRVKSDVLPIEKGQVVAVFHGYPLRMRVLSLEESMLAGICSKKKKTKRTLTKWLTWHIYENRTEVCTRLPYFQVCNENITIATSNGIVCLGVDAIDSINPVSNMNCANVARHANVALQPCLDTEWISSMYSDGSVQLKVGTPPDAYILLVFAIKRIEPDDEVLLNYDSSLSRARDVDNQGMFCSTDVYYYPHLNKEEIKVVNHDGVDSVPEIKTVLQNNGSNNKLLCKKIKECFALGKNTSETAVVLQGDIVNPMIGSKIWAAGDVQYFCELVNLEMPDMNYYYLTYLCHCTNKRGDLDNNGRNYLSGLIRLHVSPITVTVDYPENIFQVESFVSDIAKNLRDQCSELEVLMVSTNRQSRQLAKQSEQLEKLKKQLVWLMTEVTLWKQRFEYMELVENTVIDTGFSNIETPQIGKKRRVSGFSIDAEQRPPVKKYKSGLLSTIELNERIALLKAESIPEYPELRSNPISWTDALCRYELFKRNEIGPSQLTDQVLTLLKPSSNEYFEALCQFAVTKRGPAKSFVSSWVRGAKGKAAPDDSKYMIPIPTNDLFSTDVKEWRAAHFNLIFRLCDDSRYDGEGSKLINMLKVLNPHHTLYETMLTEYLFKVFDVEAGDVLDFNDPVVMKRKDNLYKCWFAVSPPIPPTVNGSIFYQDKTLWETDMIREFLNRKGVAIIPYSPSKSRAWGMLSRMEESGDDRFDQRYLQNCRGRQCNFKSMGTGENRVRQINFKPLKGIKNNGSSHNKSFLLLQYLHRAGIDNENVYSQLTKKTLYSCIALMEPEYAGEHISAKDLLALAISDNKNESERKRVFRKYCQHLPVRLQQCRPNDLLNELIILGQDLHKKYSKLPKIKKGTAHNKEMLVAARPVL